MIKTKTTEKGEMQEQKSNSRKEFEDTFKPRKVKMEPGPVKKEKAKIKNKKSRGKVFLVLLAVLVLLGGAGAVLYHNGVLTPVLERFGLVEPAGETQLTPEEREALLTARETALSDREEAVGKREERLAAKEAELEAQEGQPEESQTFGEMLEEMSEEELEYLKKVSSIYSKMDPAGAVSIMASMYDLNEISSIVYYMQPAASALLLEQMDAKTAADVTQIILN